MSSELRAPLRAVTLALPVHRFQMNPPAPVDKSKIDRYSDKVSSGAFQSCEPCTQILGVIAHYDTQQDKYKMNNLILSAKGGEDEYISRCRVQVRASFSRCVSVEL